MRLRGVARDAYNNLDSTLSRLERIEESEAPHRRAIALKPDFAAAHARGDTP